MAKEPTAATAPAEPAAFPQSIEEFCSHLSLTDARVELIGAFHAVEKRAGRVKDLAEQYLARFEAFINAPA